MKRLTVYEGPDRLDRYFYMLEWVAHYFPGHPRGEHKTRLKGQCFFAPICEPLPKHVRDFREDNRGEVIHVHKSRESWRREFHV